MKFLKVGISALITIALVYALNRSWNFGSPIPPLGKFLDPFHGFWQNAETEKVASNDWTLSGIKDEVSIVYDSLLIPHVFAKNEEDLYFAQGFVTAKDRLWQMEFQTHAGAGRISEIIGSAALDFDRTQRRMGMVFAAENALQAMDKNPLAKMLVESYTRGINAYIETLSYENLPLEYKLLGYQPEPWTSLKCALLLKNMAKTLNIGERDLEVTNALKLFGKETVDILYPDYENPGDPIVDKPGSWKFDPVKISDSIPLALPDELVNVKSTLEKPTKDVGSNNWAVSGTKTATGAPILCSDPHLSLGLPSIWYSIHLSSPEVNVMGVSLPGSPAVIIGFNDSIAWGLTNAQRDLVDYFKIQFKDNQRNEYLSDGQWKPVKKVVEEFKVKGGNSFFDTLIYTHHGPVMYDRNFHGESEKNGFAYRWISHDPSQEIITFYKLNHAKNHADYMDALDHFSSPAQNFAFASVSGDIAIRVQGKYPVRRTGEGKYLLDGTKTSQEWQAFIPNDQNVMDKNPARGFVSSANQYPVDATYPYYVMAPSFEPYRNRRINQVLSGLTNITPQDMMKLQFDTYNLKASESLPYWLSQLDSTKLNEEETKAYQILKAWNFYNTIDSEGASYYEAWWDALYPLIWDEMKDSKVDLAFPTYYNTIKLIKDRPDLSFFDIVTTPEKETAHEIIQKAFADGVQFVSKWKAEHGKEPRWADYKDTYIGHLMRLEAFSYHVQHGGNHEIVNASTRTHGPSWRMVVSMEKTGVKAWGVYPGGQSGNPGSPYYNSMLDAWTKGNYFHLQFTNSIEQLKQKSIGYTSLKPSTK